MYYSDLGDNAKADFLQYTISSLLLIDLPDGDILNMFARLNTYSVKLNNQELLNSQYFGYYKQLVYRLASEYGTFWIDNKIWVKTLRGGYYENQQGRIYINQVLCC